MPERPVSRSRSCSHSAIRSSSMSARRAITASRSCRATPSRRPASWRCAGAGRAPHHRDPGPGGQGRGRDHGAQFLRPGRRRHPGSRSQREVRAQAALPAGTAGMGRPAEPRGGPGDPGRATSTSRPSSTTSGATSSSSTWSAIRRSRPTPSRSCARRPAGPTPCATCAPSPRRSIPGGATARPTGRPRTRAGGSTTSGCRGP